MGVKFTNNSSTTVATGINTTATSLVVASATGFPTLSGSGDYCYLTIQQASGNILEVVKATALSSNTFTIVRAQDGTSAGSWSAGDVVELRITAALLTDIAEQADETVSLTGAGATSVSGTYPNFTVTSADTNTTYSVGDGGLTSNNFTNALKSKLDGIEASADVTDHGNVTSAGALMDSELTSVGSIKQIDQNLSTSSYPTFNTVITTTEVRTPKIITNSTNANLDLDPNGSGKVVFKGSSSRGAGQFVLNCEQNSHGITIKGPPHSANASYTLTLPNNDGSSNQLLKTDGSGNLSWATVAGGVDGIRSDTTTDIIRLSSANKVGIGQNVGNALALLHVYQQSGSGDLFKIQTAAGGKLLMNNSGNLGIGTDSPSQLLDVNGTVELNNLTVGGAQGSDGQVLTSTGSGVGWEAAGLPYMPGYDNIRLGTGAGPNFTGQVSRTTVVGVNAGNDISGGSASTDNTAIGYNALAAQGATSKNTVLGSSAMESCLSAGSGDGMNVVIGYAAAQDAKQLKQSTIIGAECASNIHVSSTSGATYSLLAMGYRTLHACTGQPTNVLAIGNNSFPAATSTSYNFGVGHSSGQHVTTATECTFVGNSSGRYVTTGSKNTMIGTGTLGASGGATTRSIVIGHYVQASGDTTFTFGYQSNDSAIANGATTITAPSDERYKEEITDSTAGLSFIKDLRPVTFKWKKEKDIPNTHNAYVEDSEVRVMNEYTNHGFIAQEVKAVIDSHSEIKDGFDMWKEDASDGRQRLGPSALIPILVKAIQELEARVNELESN